MVDRNNNNNNNTWVIVLKLNPCMPNGEVIWEAPLDITICKRMLDTAYNLISNQKKVKLVIAKKGGNITLNLNKIGKRPKSNPNFFEIPKEQDFEHNVATIDSDTKTKPDKCIDLTKIPKTAMIITLKDNQLNIQYPINPYIAEYMIKAVYDKLTEHKVVTGTYLERPGNITFSEESLRKYGIITNNEN